MGVGGIVDPSCVELGLLVRGNGGGISAVVDDCVGIFMALFIISSTFCFLVRLGFFVVGGMLSVEPDQSLEPSSGLVMSSTSSLVKCLSSSRVISLDRVIESFTISEDSRLRKTALTSILYLSAVIPSVCIISVLAA